MSNITCYGWSGLAFTGNYQCPGSDACCGNVTFCTDTRLCLKDDGELVRSPCMNDPYTTDSCAQICLYDETTGYLPRVTICEDGSYCCDNNEECCVNKQGVFLNSSGIVTATDSASSATSSSSSATTTSSSSKTSSTTTASATPTSASASTTTSSAAATSTTAASSSGGLSAGASAGIGVGVALVVILVALGSFFAYRRKKKASNIGMQTHPELPGESSYTDKPPAVYGGPTSEYSPHTSPSTAYQPSSAHPPSTAGGSYQANHMPPAEMDGGPHPMYEMDGGSAR